MIRFNIIAAYPVRLKDAKKPVEYGLILSCRMFGLYETEKSSLIAL